MYPLASLLATEQVHLGDMISVNWNGSENGLLFLKEAEGALVPMDSPVPGAMVEAAAASSDGRHVIAPVKKLVVSAEELPFWPTR